MKSPQPEGAPPLEISIEELEALVEQARQARPALSEDGYQKLLGAIQTLRYVTELLDKESSELGGSARVVVSGHDGENGEGAEAGGDRQWFGEALDGSGSTRPQAQSAGPWAQRRSGV